MLQKSSKDKVAFSIELVRRFAQVERMYARKGMLFAPSKSIMDAIARAKPMHHRFAERDFRHSVEEAQAEHDVSIWLVNQWRTLHSQPRLTQPTWSDFSGDDDK